MTKRKKTYKTYDSYAFCWAKRLKDGNLAHEFLEKPAMYARLPKLKGKTVLCLGCGSGEECRYIKSLGAKRVVGIDISRDLVAYAKKKISNVEFYLMDIRKLDFPKNSFDFIYSSLTMHYVKKWDRILSKIYTLLKKGGTFLFSTHHPLKWGAKIQRLHKVNSFLIGYERYSDGNFKVFGDYFNVRKIKDIWFDEFEVTYYHQPLSRIISSILKSGFKIKNFIEPKSLQHALTKKNGFYEIHNKIPVFMIFELKK